ncbi:MAG: DEAD/DEAH box helicase [Blastocatellia bacterium]
MNIFDFRNHLVDEYQQYIKSFMRISDERIVRLVETQLSEGIFYPDPLIQLNPSFARGESIERLIANGQLHPECARIFRREKDNEEHSGRPLNLHRHQEEAIREAAAGRNYVLTTGTGSGKSLSYIIPIVDHVLREGSGKGIRAIVVYPMNALANSQEGELDKYLAAGYPAGHPPVTYARYTGQDDQSKREEILRRPPDILLTNYVMLELLLTRPFEQRIIEAAQGLRFLVLDELHTYRGRQGADVALLVRRLRDRLAAERMLCVGTSATIAGGESLQLQRDRVAMVASTIFGAAVYPESVILETLDRRTTAASTDSDPQWIDRLRQRVVTAKIKETFPKKYDQFIADPLVGWIESNLGLDECEGRLVRRRPTRITGSGGAAERLSKLLAIPPETCRQALQNALLAGTECERHPVTGAAPLTFRLHQFFSRGGTVEATLESEAIRYLTLFRQHFRPGSREHILLPLVFCRECGQEYYSVRRLFGKKSEPDTYVARPDNDQSSEDGVSEPGFLYLRSEDPFPVDPAEMIERLPQEWIVEGPSGRRVDPDRRGDLPRPVRIGTNGRVDGEGLTFSYLTAPFRFCLTCGVSWNSRQRDDFSKLATLGSEGRSTATTITNLTAIRRLRDEKLPSSARKLLSFTDNRQDASLQAGHFNDFIETTLIRAALYRALDGAGEDGIGHDDLTGRVFDTLRLDPVLYSQNPDEKFQNRRETEAALRNLLGYRLYRDLERGWRITLPNLEQCGLLRIEYQSLDEICADEDEWVKRCEPLRLASPATRQKIGQVLLDHLRRELAISVRYLDPGEQDRIRNQSYQRLIAPWAIDEIERLIHASILFPGPRRSGDGHDNIHLSSRSGFGQYLRRPQTFGPTGANLTTSQTQEVIDDLLEVLARAGLLHRVVEGRGDQPPGYQLNAGAMRWKQGDGVTPFHDPIRMPSPSASLPDGNGQADEPFNGRTNRYFVNFYRSDLADLRSLEAREHTAQVPGELREEREQLFRDGTLPLLYCSPTMELGVDIADLNVVNLRNVPPTPANYAQRSGRAGRSGQPALVFTYCALGSPHDQYFFKRPELMVAGQVTPPRLDLANEDLVRAHIHAIWLAETGQSLQKSLVQLLDVAGESPSLELLEGLRVRIDSEAAQRRAARRARQVLETIRPELEQAGWFNENWLDDILRHCAERFDRTADRWRDLYRAALNEQEKQSRIIRDASRSAADKNLAKQTRSLAEAQLRLLAEVDNIGQSDFYSYRYFASEGFLPGYSFPRLPISAYIPARRGNVGRNEYVSRPRFLAISEFGPRSILYHEGSKYVINKVILPVGDDEVGNVRIKLCGTCGYLHEILEGSGEDLCQRCRAPLGVPLTSLFRMQNVSTQRRERITADEEERLRYGYEIITGVRFRGAAAEVPTATVVCADGPLAKLT